MGDISVYGTYDCEDTLHTLELLSNWRVNHAYFDLHQNPRARQLVERWYPQGHRTPIVVVESSGARLVEPTESELRVALVSLELIKDAA